MFATKKIKVAPLKPNPPVRLSPRLTVRSDEADMRRIADTDGTARRMRQMLEDNRLR